MKRALALLLAVFLAAAGARAQQSGADEAAAGKAPPPEHSAEEALDALRPVLIGKRYLDQAAKRLAVQLARMGGDRPPAWFEDNALVASDFVADVRVMYALEFKEGTQLVSQGMMKSWGMDAERLHQRALANLDRLYGEIPLKQVGKLPWLRVIDTRDDYAASRVLLHWRWAELTLALGEALILGMPTRDVVVMTATLEPAKIAQLRETVDTVERHQGRPVTRKLFQWTPQGWLEFAEGSEESQQQGGEGGEQQGAAEGKMPVASLEAQANVAGQPAAAQGGQARQEEGADQHGDQHDQQPLQHGQ